jgi:hypothetical protein
MRWFQLDSDTPEDPKIQDILATFGNAGFGALVRLWCFTAKHGARPGWTIDSRGRPIRRSFLVAATGLSDRDFDLLIGQSRENKLVNVRMTKRGPVFWFPAMSRRTDEYTKKVVRTMSGQSPDNVRQQYITRQDKVIKNSARPRAVPSDSYRVVLKLVHQAILGTPDRSFANLKDIVKSQCAQHQIAYDADVVAKAIESALTSTRKKSQRAG